MKSDPFAAAIIILAVLIAAVFTALIRAEFNAVERWETWCESIDGHVDSSTQTSTVVTYGADGKPSFGTTSHTTRYCLTEDGRILDIRD